MCRNNLNAGASYAQCKYKKKTFSGFIIRIFPFKGAVIVIVIYSMMGISTQN